MRQGDVDAAGELLPLLYDELRALAASYLRRERAGHTLQPTALVHEVYLRLAGGASDDWSGRAHFLAVAAKVMRNTLVNHALARKAAKRGGGAERVLLDGATLADKPGNLDSLDVHEALERLAALDERKARVVEMRFFGGLTSEEIAHVLHVSLSTIEADWRMARAWLAAELEETRDD
ncbi:RNA polymerase sigma factor [Phycisphaerae bacterium RAS1]|nr:RNA polymerase sigma factor [Phycisphaerae bacterium RAS1]